MVSFGLYIYIQRDYGFVWVVHIYTTGLWFRLGTIVINGCTYIYNWTHSECKLINVVFLSFRLGFWNFWLTYFYKWGLNIGRHKWINCKSYKLKEKNEDDMNLLGYYCLQYYHITWIEEEKNKTYHFPRDWVSFINLF